MNTCTCITYIKLLIKDFRVYKNKQNIAITCSKILCDNTNIVSSD